MLNLHTHSYYSYKTGLLSIKDIVKFAKENGEKFFCIADNSITSYVKAFNEAKNNDLTFVPGYEVRYLPDGDFDVNKILSRRDFLNKEKVLKRTTEQQLVQYEKELDEIEFQLNTPKPTLFHSMILIAINEDGIKSIFDIYSSEKYDSNLGFFISDKERIFFDKNGEQRNGLIYLSGGNNSEAIHYLRNGEYEALNQYLGSMKSLGNNFYCNIEACEALQNEYLDLISLCKEKEINIIATNEIFYGTKDEENDYHLFNNIMNVEMNKMISTTIKCKSIPNALKHNIHKHQHLMTEETLISYYKNMGINDEDIKSLFDSIESIKSRLDIDGESIEDLKSRPLQDQSEKLEELCLEGWNRLRKGTTRENESWERFHYELEIINRKNFSEYFIKVREITKLAYELGILVGPSRGSGGGSEVCFLIGIIHIDPLKYGLLFERFLNPGRNNMPDIDLDISSSVESDGRYVSSRNLLVEKLIEKGVFNFSGFISNEVTATSLVLFKNLAKYYELPFEEANKITTDMEYAEKLSEDEYDGWLKEAVDKYGYEWEDFWDKIERFMPFCYKYSGVPYNRSIAASGVIMAEIQDNQILPSHINPLDENENHLPFNGEDLESWNFIKFDLLSINTLNFIEKFESIDIEWDIKTKIKLPISNDYFGEEDIVELKSGEKIKAIELFRRIQNGEKFEV